MPNTPQAFSDWRPDPTRVTRIEVVSLLTVFLLFVAAFTTGCNQQVVEQSLRIDQFLMGTSWSIQLRFDPIRRNKVEEATLAAFAEVARIESIMSEWRQDSALTALNDSAGGIPVEVPDELREIIQRGVEYGRLSSGAFDITWLGMKGLWRLDDDFRVPSAAEVETAQSLVNFAEIVIEEEKVGLPRPRMAIGLGGMAKGYAVDRAASVLRDAQFFDFLIDGGGDLYAAGSRGTGAWRIGVRQPDSPAQLLAQLEVENLAVVTSGDYERFHVVDGIRYHHIIDPRTGWPARGCRSVTVVAKQTEQADALATAIFVLGAEKGLELAETLEGVEVLIVDPENHPVWSSGFLQYGRLIR